MKNIKIKKEDLIINLLQIIIIIIGVPILFALEHFVWHYSIKESCIRLTIYLTIYMVTTPIIIYYINEHPLKILNKKAKKLGEEILYKGYAKFVVDTKKIRGCLFITKEKIIFKSDTFIKKYATEIPLKDAKIRTYIQQKSFIPKAILEITQENITDKFILKDYDGDLIIRTLMVHCPQCTIFS